MRAAVLVALLSLPLFAQLPEGASLEIRVQEVKGEVEYQAAPKTEWKVAQVGDILPVGTKLCTGVDSGAVLAFGTNSVAMLQQASMMNIAAFEMKGDELVAQVKIDPGVCSVSVKQLAQFQTDFQVSTPRLTASVRGSGYTAKANGDEVPDNITVDEHFAQVVQASGAERGVAQGGATNSNNIAPDQNALAQNIVDAVFGLADNEQDPGLLASVAQNIGVDAGSLNGFGNPVANGNVGPQEPQQPQEPILGVAQFTLTWGADPRDLDAHLQGPLLGGGRDEVFFGHRTSNDTLMFLDTDNTNGFGPEVSHINQLLPNGSYTYYVNLFSGTGTFGSSPAVVNYESQTQNVQMQATGAGANWIVGKVDVDALGNAVFTPIDTYGAAPANE